MSPPIPATHTIKMGGPIEERIASALETIALCQIAQAHDLRNVDRNLFNVVDVMTQIGNKKLGKKLG